MEASGPAPVAVRAADVALGNLRPQDIKTARMFDQDAQRSFLGPAHVIEFEDDDVRLTAVDTRMFREVRVEKEPVPIAIALRMLANAGV
jgi:hypothetical protein